MEDISKFISQLRSDFIKMKLSEEDVNQSPIVEFNLWMKQAIESKVNEPNAMVLSTASKEGKPTARIVLLRGITENKFGFFTNYESRKATEMTENPFACLTFFWPELERQVRIEGRIIKAPKDVSDAYFYARQRNSKIGAWSSPQSKVLKTREELEHLVTNFDKRYPNEDVPRPDFWGGYFLVADYFEFWQGRSSRLHDRIRYTKDAHDNWTIARLAP